MRPLSSYLSSGSPSPRGLLFDLDDTLLTHGRLTREAYDALWMLHDAAFYLVAVTGRPSGWGELLVRQWPIDAAVTENGAVHVWREGAGLKLYERCTPEERHARRMRLARLVSRVEEKVPEARLADDVGARRSDITWDIGERVSMPKDRVDLIAAEILAAGARTTRSSVHIHATFDEDDKASGSVELLQRQLGVDPGAALRTFAFVGDSSNDAACFAAYALTFGVANVEKYVARLSVPPRFVSAAAMGAGFAEIARALVHAKGSGPILPGTMQTVAVPAPAGPSKVEAPTSRNEELAAVASRHLYGNYRPAPIAFVRGSGCELVDADGQKWLDLCAGVAVCSVGHAHPTYVEALSAQVAKVTHVSNWFLNEQNVLAAKALCERTGMDRAFFCNSGAEANEAMLKLARHHFFGLGQPSRSKVIAFQSSFHGRTLGALAMTGTPKYHEGFGPVTGIVHVPFGDLDAVKRVLSDDVAAINVEPIQGEGGVCPAPEGFLKGLRALCDSSGALFLADEVQTGVGRTGHFLAVDGAGVKPDVVALAKGVGGGVPVGVMLTREKLAGALPPGTHGTTFGGNPLASAAILAVLRILDDEGVIPAVRVKGEHLGAGLKAIAADYPGVCESARGEGLLWGLVLKAGFVARDVLPKVLAHRVLLTGAGERVLRFCPPLTVTTRELDVGLTALRKVVQELARV